MALIRIRGNFDGIVNYLKTGHKSGRLEGRDELDDRFTLCGNIDLLDQSIKSIHSDRIRYTHVTISFKEDGIDEKTLKKVVDYYRHLIFSAYREDEYLYYAEAHIPRMKKVIGKNGIVRSRKPHCHIVVPNINLKTGKAVNPWGGVHKHHLEFHDAIQEAICAKFGSISPSLSRRTDFNMESDVLEGYRGDVFLDNKKHIKQIVLDGIIEKNISSKVELRTFLRTLGETKTRNRGKLNEYEAIKPTGATNFTNLREYVFTQEFLKLTPSSKKKHCLSRKLNPIAQ